MKVKDVIKKLKDDGWVLVRQEKRRGAQCCRQQH